MITATAIAALDVLFVLVAVPESLPQKLKVSAWAPLAWEQADPFAALRKVGKDKTVLLLCVTVLLSYLPEVSYFDYQTSGTQTVHDLILNVVF